MMISGREIRHLDSLRNSVTLILILSPRGYHTQSSVGPQYKVRILCLTRTNIHVHIMTVGIDTKL